MPNLPDDADALYRFLVEGMTDYAIYMLSADGIVVSWNAGAQRAQGYTTDEIVGRHFSCFYTLPDRIAGLPEQSLEIARERGRFEAEGWRLRKDGSRFWTHVVVDAIRDSAGRPIGFAKITRDCSERRATALKLENALTNLDLALSNMTQGLCLIDGEGRVVLVNAAMRDLLRAPSCEALAGAAIGTLLSDSFSEEASALFARNHLGLDPDRSGPATSEIEHRDRILSVTTRRLTGGGCVSTFIDITEQRRFEDQIQYLALHDALTGLANRAALQQFLAGTLAAQAGTSCAVLCIDLDRFKTINDTFGHSVGDQLLREVAHRLRSALRPPGLIARLGGDEFAIILRSDAFGRFESVARTILGCLSQPYSVERLSIRVGASIGIAIAPTAGGDPDALLRNACLALQAAKTGGGDRYALYEPVMGDRVTERASMEADLRRALEERAFVLHYQPIVRARTGAIIGYEALLRWPRAGGEAISPATFVPVAEEAGLMPEIGAWVLAEACREAAGWPDHLTVAVNVSATQLRGGVCLQAVERALAGSGLAPHRLEIEITETALLENRELALGLLRRLRALGVMIALDDFGTGYSSLSFVHTFPLTRIKIDRSFVRGLGRDAQSMAIVRAIIGLSRSLGLAVTAEGVETEEQHRLLARKRGLDLQGFLFGRPEAPARLETAAPSDRRGAFESKDLPVDGRPRAVA
ncbi:EAL domain-containing protein [Methylorubrum populi]